MAAPASRLRRMLQVPSQISARTVLCSLETLRPASSATPIAHASSLSASRLKAAGYDPWPVEKLDQYESRCEALSTHATQRWERLRLAWQVTGDINITAFPPADASQRSAGRTAIAGSESDGEYKGRSARSRATGVSRSPSAVETDGASSRDDSVTSGSLSESGTPEPTSVSTDESSSGGRVRNKGQGVAAAGAGVSASAAGAVHGLEGKVAAAVRLNAADLSDRELDVLARTLTILRRTRRVRQPRIHKESIKMTFVQHPEEHVKLTKPLPLPAMIEIMIQVWEETGVL